MEYANGNTIYAKKIFEVTKVRSKRRKTNNAWKKAVLTKPYALDSKSTR